MPAKFYDHQTRSALKDRRRLSAWLDELVGRYIDRDGKVSLAYIFCTDDYLLEINQQFLNHDTFTDIITFDMTEDGERLNGEIYISIPRVKENAKDLGVSYNDELHRVIFHGALHLCGFKDKTAADKNKMRQMEDTCMDEYLRDK